jgi:hypothetical protein
MEDFKALRTKAGYADRLEFCRFAGISPRTLSAYDMDVQEPPRALVMFLDMLAKGCRYCQQCQQCNQKEL